MCVDNELAGPSRLTGLSGRSDSGGATSPPVRVFAAQEEDTVPPDDWWADQVMAELNNHQRPPSDSARALSLAEFRPEHHDPLETPGARAQRLRSQPTVDSPRLRAPGRRREAAGGTSTPRRSGRIVGAASSLLASSRVPDVLSTPPEAPVAVCTPPPVAAVAVCTSGTVVNSSLSDAPLCSSSDDELMEGLEERLCVPLQTPLIRGPPRLRRTRTPAAAQSLRRSERIAAAPREADSTKQAQLVLMQKLGVAPPSHAVDAEVVREYKAAFRQPLSEASLDALQMLLGGTSTQ